MHVPPEPRRLGALLVLALLAASLPARSRAGDDDKIEIGALDIHSLLDLSVEAVTRRTERASQAPAAVFVLTGDDLRRHGFRTLVEVLGTAPGLFAYPGNFPQVGVRGMGVLGDFTTRLLVLIDGHPLANAMGQDLGRGLPLPLAAIERIEIIKGPVGSVYGPSAFEGVINLVTTEGASGLGGWAGGEASQGRAQAGEASATWRGQPGGAELLVSADVWRSRGQDWTFPDAGGMGLPPKAIGLDRADSASAYARLRAGDLGAAAGCGHSHAGMPAAAYIINPTDDRTALDGTTCFAELTYQARLTEALTLRPRLAFDDLEQGAVQAFPPPGAPSPISIGAYHHAGFDRWATGELRVDWRPAAWARLDVGATLQLHRMFQHTFSDAMAGLETERTRDVRTVNTWLLAEVEASRTLTFHAGLTYFDHSVFGRQLTPKVAAVWQPAPDDTLKAIFSTGFRPPTFVEALYQDQVFFLANPALKPETVASGELFYEHRFGVVASVSGSLFANRYRDLIRFAIVPAPGLGRPPDPANPNDFRQVAQNVESLTDVGGELALRLRFGDALQAYGGLSLQRPSQVDRANFPRATANLSLSTSAPWRPLSLSLRATAISARDKEPALLLPGQRDAVPAAVLLGAGATLEVPGLTGLEVELSVVNLLDARAASTAPPGLSPVSELPATARTVRADLRWRP